jgi:hypothetical protein
MSPFAASDRLGPPASRSIGSDVEIKFTRLCTEKRMLCSPPTPSAPPRHGLIAEAGGFGMLAPPIILHPDEHGDNSYRQPNKERANISPVIVMTKDSLHRPGDPGKRQYHPKPERNRNCPSYQERPGRWSARRYLNPPVFHITATSERAGAR